MGSSRKDRDPELSRSMPARTPEEQENHLISLAVQQAEHQLEAGNAPVPVVTHYLKLASIRESSERKRLELENELLKAKTEQLSSGANAEKLAEDAINAFRTYSGQGDDEDYAAANIY